MRFISWNVNGLRALMKKGFMEQLEAFKADAVCLQETKLQAGQLELQLPGYYQYWNYAERKGYSGTAIFTRHEPISVRYGMGLPEHDTEGRVITLEYPGFYLITCYTPNSKDGLLRLPYRETWEDCFRDYLCTLDADKPLILCGDLNVAHEEIDLKNPDTNHLSAGFSDEERAKFSTLLDAGFVDTFRFLYPEQKDAYSWWSYRTAARKRNAGWRIDYFIVSQRLIPYTKDAAILSEVMGSDHCPVSLDLDPPEEELRHG